MLLAATKAGRAAISSVRAQRLRPKQMPALPTSLDAQDARGMPYIARSTKGRPQAAPHLSHTITDLGSWSSLWLNTMPGTGLRRQLAPGCRGACVFNDECDAKRTSMIG
jgi:hypothetical protein